MPKLYDLVKCGVECQLRLGDSQYFWNGKRLFTGNLKDCYAVEALLFDSEWELNGPTVNNVLAKRGWHVTKTGLGDGHVRIERGINIRPFIGIDTPPTDPAEMTRIINFLESLERKA